MTDLKKVMQNVMAVLNSYGVVYSPFEHSDCVFGLPKDFLLVRERLGRILISVRMF